MTTLVTGGTGFLGRHLVDRLVERGEDVRVLTRSHNAALADLGVEIVEGSLGREEDVERAVEGVDRVYHLAGKVERDRKRAHLMFELHVDGTRRLLRALVDEDVDKIVYASTSGTVGVSDDPDFVATEASPTAEQIVKDWPYYLSKIYAERVCRRFVDAHDLPIVMMRPTLLLGPGDHNVSSTGDVVRFLEQKIPVAMPGGISFVDVRDTADAFIRAMGVAEAGENYLLGACNLRLVEFFERLETITGIPRPRLPVPSGAAVLGARLLERTLGALGREASLDAVSVEMARYYWYIDSSKAEHKLDWRPRDPDETLRDTVRWIRANHPDFAGSGERKPPPEEFVPAETIAYADKIAGGD